MHRYVSLALLRAEEKFREVLARAGRNPPVLDRIASETDALHDRVLFNAIFYEQEPLPPNADITQLVNPMMRRVDWFLSRRELDELPHGTLCTAGGNWLIGEYRSLYSRMYEAHLMEMELRPRREYVEQLAMLTTNRAAIAQAWEEYRQFERHVRRNHAYAGDLRGSMREIPFEGYSHLDRPRNRQTFNFGTFDWRAATTNTVSTPPSSVSWSTVPDFSSWDVGRFDPPQRRLIEERMRAVEATMGNALGMFGQLSSEVGTPAAQAKGIELLKSWLTPEQAAQYEKTKSFEVVGSDTKKRYRIKHGRQMNIEEIDASGKRVRGLCALPEGGVVAGDCVLAQKLALETNEKQFLAVANKFA